MRVGTRQVAKGEWAETTLLIHNAAAVFAEQRPMTLRQMLYRLVSIGVIENSTAEYKRLSRVLTKARLDGRIDFGDMVDRSRPDYIPNVWENVPEYLRTVSHAYHKGYWADQPRRVEIWTEKDAILGSIDSVTKAWGVPVRVTRGFNSTTRVYELAQVIAASPKPMTVFYLGDHDPSGRCIESEQYDRIRLLGANFALKRLAIHPADITQFKLPPLRIKQSDSRAEGFLRNYGEDCVELDALPPVELRRRIEEAVTSLLDRERWSRAVEVEKVELASVAEFVKTWPGSRQE